MFFPGQASTLRVSSYSTPSVRHVPTVSRLEAASNRRRRRLFRPFSPWESSRCAAYKYCSLAIKLCFSLSLMEGATGFRPRMKELFMSNIQQNSRACAYLHCAYIVRPLSSFQIIEPDEVVGHIADRLAIRKGTRIHLSTPEKIILSFPSHSEAL